MRPTALLAFLLVALSLLPFAQAIHAEEGTPGETRYVTQMATLPEPSAAHAIDIEAPLFTWDGKPLGTFTLQAKPVRSTDGTAVWSVSEKITLSGTDHYWMEVATLDRYLRPLRGQAGGNRPKMRPYKVTWQESGTGYDFSRQFTAGNRTITESASIERPRPVTATLAAICLFCRMTLPEEGTFEVGMLSPDADQESKIVQRAMWTQGQRGKWQDQASWVVKGARHDKNLIEIHLHPETKDILGLRFGRGTQGFRGEVRVPQAEPVLPRAQNAQEAARRGVLAFASGDIKLLERTMHWPTLYTRAKTAYEAQPANTEPFSSLAAWKQAQISNLSETLTKRPRTMIEAGLKGAAGQVKTEERAGGVTRFTYPALFQNMTLDVAMVNGAWFVVDWPGTSDG